MIATEFWCKEKKVGVEIKYKVIRKGKAHNVHSRITMAVDNDGRLCLNCGNGRLVLRPSVANEIIVEVE